jgi:hypothetical protein
MAILSFKTIFVRYGKLLSKFLSENIEKGGKEWVPFNPAYTRGTVTSTKTKTGRIKSKQTSPLGTHPRMIVTGKTKENAFKYKAEDQKLTLFVDARYQDIIEGNNRGGNFIRKNQVYLFPVAASESTFEQTTIIQDLKKEVTKEVQEYFQKILDTEISRTIQI